MVVKGVIAAGVASWLVAPWIEMSRRGTVDTRTVAGWRQEPSGCPRAFVPVEVPVQRVAAERAGAAV